MKRITCIIQARTGSTRLPSKVLLPLLGTELLYHVVERAKRASSLDNLVIATTTKAEDDILEKLCRRYGWDCFRHISADVNDLTGLYFAGALFYKADIIVRLTADNPLIDPYVIDLVVNRFKDELMADYVGNCELPLTFPIGIAVEVFSFTALQRIWLENKNWEWRGNATQPIRKQPEIFRIVPVYNDKDYSWMRWTVDTPADYEFVQKVFQHFGHNNFTMQQVIDSLLVNPEWLEINKGVEQRT